MKAEIYIELLNKILSQYKNSKKRARFIPIHVLFLINYRFLIIINNSHDIKQSIRTIISNGQMTLSKSTSS